MLPATTKYIGVTTIGGHVARAIDFQARQDVYAVLGKSSPWVPTAQDPTLSDENPPVPSPAAVNLDDPVVVKKCVLNLVVPDAAGSITAYGQKWRLVTPAEAPTLGARWVLVTASFDYNEAPVSAFDSFLVEAAAAGATTLELNSVVGYQVGHVLQLGIAGQEVTVTNVNAATNVLTVNSALVSALPTGTYITNTTEPSKFSYRQVAVVSHASSTGLPGQQLVPYSFLEDPILVYYYNTTPIPRALNRRDSLVLILTF
jgi:hypothetical protein